MSDQLKRLRDQIDALDDEILKLVSQRARHAEEIGKLKVSKTIYRAEREAQILRRLQEKNSGPLPSEAVIRLFREIVSSCRALEDGFTVAFLGPQGTFSEEAALKHFGGAVTHLPCASIDEVFRAVEADNVGYGVVPVENSTEGAVGRSLDLLLQSPVKICGEVVLPIHQHFMSKSSHVAAVNKIFSHAQSLAQCHEWLNQHYPNAERVAVASNAEAARLAAGDEQAAAIAGKNAANSYGLAIYAQNIEDDPKNTTRFLVIGAHDAAPSGKDKTSLAMSAKNQPGAVYHLLAPLARHGVSMSKLESRPARTGLWEYVFFVDVEGHRKDDSVAQALAEIEAQAMFLKILGSYPAAPV